MSQTVFQLTNDFTKGGADYQVKAAFFSAMGHICAVSFIACFLCLRKNHLNKAVPIIVAIGLANSLYTIAGYYFGFGKLPMSIGYSGLIDYASANSALIATCSIPLLAMGHKLSFVGLAVNLIAIALGLSAIPYGVLSIGIAAYLFASRSIKKELWAVYLTATSAPLIVYLCVDGIEAFTSAKRFTAYYYFMSTWWKSKFVLFGTGPSTFAAVSEEIQKRTGFDVLKDGSIYWWKYLHSDVLLVPFQWGLCGLLLFSVVTFEVFKRLYDKKESQVFSVAACLFASAIFGYPSSFALPAGLITFCVVYAYTKD